MKIAVPEWEGRIDRNKHKVLFDTDLYFLGVAEYAGMTGERHASFFQN